MWWTTSVSILLLACPFPPVSLLHLPVVGYVQYRCVLTHLCLSSSSISLFSFSNCIVIFQHTCKQPIWHPCVSWPACTTSEVLRATLTHVFPPSYDAWTACNDFPVIPYFSSTFHYYSHDHNAFSKSPMPCAHTTIHWYTTHVHVDINVYANILSDNTCRWLLINKTMSMTGENVKYTWQYFQACTSSALTECVNFAEANCLSGRVMSLHACVRSCLET